MAAWVIVISLLALIAWMLFALLRNVKSVFVPSKEEMMLWDGPQPTEQEEHEAMLFVQRYMEHNPDSVLADYYPELVMEANAGRWYAMYDQQLRDGRITQAEYDSYVDKLLDALLAERAKRNTA